MSKHRRYRGFAAPFAGAVIATSMIGSSPNRSDALLREDGANNCDGVIRPNVNYQFVNGTAAWTAPAQATYRSAIARWSRLRDELDSRYLIATEVTTGVNLNVVRGAVGTGGSNVDCAPTTDQLNLRSPEPTVAGSSFENTSAHESGHAFGVDHTGSSDTLTYNGSSSTRHPLMTGCGATASSSYPETDDQAQIVTDFNAASYKIGAINPDRGFETFDSSATYQADMWPWKGPRNLFTSGGFQGSQFAGLQTSTPLEQRVRVTSPSSNFRWRIAYKTASGVPVNVKFQTRSITYPAGDPCLDQMPGDVNYNSPSAGAFVLHDNITYGASTSWQNPVSAW